MSGRTVPTAARLSRLDLKMLRKAQEDGATVLKWNRGDGKTAARLVGGGFATSNRIAAHSYRLTLTAAGQEVLAAHQILPPYES